MSGCRSPSDGGGAPVVMAAPRRRSRTRRRSGRSGRCASRLPYVFSTPEAGPASGSADRDVLHVPHRQPAPPVEGDRGRVVLPQRPVQDLRHPRGVPRREHLAAQPADGLRPVHRPVLGDRQPDGGVPGGHDRGAPNEQYNMSAGNSKLEIQFPPTTSLGARLFTRAGITLEFNNTSILDPLTNPLIDSTLVGTRADRRSGPASSSCAMTGTSRSSRTPAACTRSSSCCIRPS